MPSTQHDSHSFCQFLFSRHGGLPPSFFWILLGLIVVTHACAQGIVLRGGLDNAPLNAYSPSSIDGPAYVNKAEIFYDDGFTAAFGDGGRIPGYPVFLSTFYHVFDEPLKAARMAQVVLSSVIILLAAMTLRVTLGSRTPSLLGSLVFAFWAPFYYFSPILTAESVSLFFAGCLCLLLAVVGRGRRMPMVFLVFSLACLVYLKANHILFVVPVAAYLYRRYAMRGRPARDLCLAAAALVTLLLPWSIFASRQAGSCVLLSAVQGEVLCAGAGLRPQCYGPEADGSLPKKTAEALDLSDMDRARKLALEMHDLKVSEKDRHCRTQAVRAWFSRPFATSLYGMSKTLHTFGFSFRDMRDCVLVLSLLVCIGASAYLWNVDAHRGWCLYLWVAIVTAACQAFVFLPDQRFKTVLVDFPALLVAVLGALTFVRRRCRFDAFRNAAPDEEG